MYNDFLQSFQLEEAIPMEKRFSCVAQRMEHNKNRLLPPNIYQIPKTIIIWLCVCTR
jgi:hypothetical protein